MTKLVKTQIKGMVTIPREFREKLGIDANCLLEARLVENGVTFIKLEYKKTVDVEIYSDKQVEEWLEDDKIDPKLSKKIKKLFSL